MPLQESDENEALASEPIGGSTADEQQSPEDHGIGSHDPMQLASSAMQLRTRVL